jgi:hypothetical protein
VARVDAKLPPAEAAVVSATNAVVQQYCALQETEISATARDLISELKPNLDGCQESPRLHTWFFLGM